MKKKFVFCIAAAALAVTSCTNDIVMDSAKADMKGKAISFSTYAQAVRNQTRAYASGDVVNSSSDANCITTGDFGVVGYMADNNIYLGSTSKAVQQTYNSTSWEYATASEIRFWPEGNMDFYAYFPYTATASFAASNATVTVMTISNWTDGQDVLYAVTKNQAYAKRVPLQFKHAFAKIKEVKVAASGDVLSSGIEVIIESAEFLKTATAGSVKVDASGDASYTASGSARKVTPASAVTVSGSDQALIVNADNAYILPTASGDYWNGQTIASGDATLDNAEKISIHLKAKVKQGSVYLVGDADTYGDMYIPATAGSTEFVAGKRYIYNIVMKDNVGFDKNGNPILKPIKFSASVVDWTDETVIDITL